MPGGWQGEPADGSAFVLDDQAFGVETEERDSQAVFETHRSWLCA